jgi:hypothetical protein
MNEVLDYRRALEALRNGVPNRDAVKVVGCGQTEIERRFRENLELTPEHLEKDKQVRGMLVSGDFGAGKSHLLQYLQHLALSENFVCSRVVISKETPLADPAKVFKAAIESAEVPGLSGQAIQEIAARLRRDSAQYAALRRCANAIRTPSIRCSRRLFCSMSVWAATPRWSRRSSDSGPAKRSEWPESDAA